jgi:hypothetical protein
MKKLAILAACLLAGSLAVAQGTINFANLAATVNAPITDANGVDCDSTFMAELWESATPDGALTKVAGSETSFSAQVAGYFLGGEITTGIAPAGADGYFQVRVWSTGYGSYEEAAASGDPTAQIGMSAGAAANGGFVATTGAPPGLPGDMSNLTSFQLAFVPEPSTIALAILGGLGLLLFRRRK